MSPSLKGGHLTGPFLERVAPSKPFVRLPLGAKDQTSNKQQAKENNVKLTLVLCGAALRGSGSQQRSGRGATTNALRCGQRRQRQAQQGQKQHA